MKVYFNSTFVERERITDDLWVKGNNGNKLEAYFENLDLSNVNINLRLVIKWKNGETTNELPMLKSYQNNYAYINLPTLKESGNVQFIIRIYLNNNLSQTAIFTRLIKDNIEPSDNPNISSDEYNSLIKNIEEINKEINSLEQKVDDIILSGGSSGNVSLANYYNKDETEELINKKINEAIYDVITGDY